MTAHVNDCCQQAIFYSNSIWGWIADICFILIPGLTLNKNTLVKRPDSFWNLLLMKTYSALIQNVDSKSRQKNDELNKNKKFWFVDNDDDNIPIVMNLSKSIHLCHFLLACFV